MGERLKGKRALVTAAAQGIGQAIARSFAAEGAQVLATDINAEALAVIADVDGIQVMPLDVTSESQIKSVVGQMISAAPPFGGRIDVLANVAGFVHQGTILECKPEDWDFSFALNVTAMYRMIRGVLPHMLDIGGGSIVNIASVASSIKGVPSRCAYGSSKAAVIGLTKSVAADYVRQGVRCNAICPGTVESPSLDERMRALGGTPQVRQAFVDRQPMGRLGRTEEIAAMAVYLAGDESCFTTGTTMVVDGGMTG